MPTALDRSAPGRAPSQWRARVTANTELSGGYVVLRALADPLPASGAAPLAAVVPGQFVMLRGEWGRELLNPRAFSVLDADGDGSFSVLLKAYGRGTTLLCAMHPGDPLTVTGPLGHGFPAPGQGGTQLLVAGGVGLPPLHLQARRAALQGRARDVELIYGGRDRDDLVLTDAIEAAGIAVRLATEDGSAGERGRVTVALSRRLDEAHARGEPVTVLACGPTPMLAAVRTLCLARDVPAWLCLEEEMACGFGVCLGCAVPVYGPRPYRYCCTDGPVFAAAEVRWP